MNPRSMPETYNEIAEWFDAARNKSLVEKPVLDMVVNRLPEQACVLDLGCGSGEPIACYLIERGLEVTGVDGAPAMIDTCRRRFPDQTWIESDLRHFETSQRFDFVIAWDSLFHLPCQDQRVLLDRFGEWTRPGGFLVFNAGWEEAEFWNRMRGRDDVAMFNASLDTREYRVRLSAGGFRILEHRIADPNCGGRSYWIARKAVSDDDSEVR